MHAPYAYQPACPSRVITGEEYTNASDQVLFSADFSNSRPLASTPNADFCVSDSNDAIYWLSALNVTSAHALLPHSYTQPNPNSHAPSPIPCTSPSANSHTQLAPPTQLVRRPTNSPHSHRLLE